MSIFPELLSASDTVTTLEPKQQGAFPDPIRFPPPAGRPGSCGCLVTEWDDIRDGGKIRLETLWQPQWDTQQLGHGDVCFFQQGNSRTYPATRTSMQAAGCFSWPQKFTLWELEFQLSYNALAIGLLSPSTDGRYVEVRVAIGEKWHLRLPFPALYPARPDNYRVALCTPLFMPSVQHFKVELVNPGVPLFRSDVRCVMNGYLHRQIP